VQEITGGESNKNDESEEEFYYISEDEEEKISDIQMKPKTNEYVPEAKCELAPKGIKSLKTYKSESIFLIHHYVCI
jgi:hypothetical protein